MVFIQPRYPSTHGIYPWYCKWHQTPVFIHPWYLSTYGIVSGIHPWYSFARVFTHGIVSEIHPLYLPTHGIYLWYCNKKNAISNKSHFVKGRVVHHNVDFTVIVCFNKTSFSVVLFALCSLFFLAF